MITLFLFFNFNSNLNICFAFFLSKLPVGSSASKILGWFISALAIATLWVSPPDNSEGKWLILLFKPKVLSTFFASLIAFNSLLFRASLARKTFSNAVKSFNRLFSW